MSSDAPFALVPVHVCTPAGAMHANDAASGEPWSTVWPLAGLSIVTNGAAWKRTADVTAGGGSSPSRAVMLAGPTTYVSGPPGATTSTSIVQNASPRLICPVTSTAVAPAAASTLMPDGSVAAPAKSSHASVAFGFGRDREARGQGARQRPVAAGQRVAQARHRQPQPRGPGGRHAVGDEPMVG